MRALTIALLFAALLQAADAPLYVFDNGVGRGVLSIEEQTELARATGYAGIFYSGTKLIPRLVEAHRVRNMRVQGIYTGMNVADKTPGFDPGLPEAIEQLKGTGALITFTVNGKAANGDDIAVPVVRQVAGMAARAGLKVAFYPHYGFHVATIEDALRLREKVGRDNVGVVFNLCHWLRSGDEANLPLRIKQALPYLYMVSINGADHKGDWDRLIQPLDSGEVDVKAFLTALHTAGYRGTIGLQCYAIKGEREDLLRRSMAAWRAMGIPQMMRTDWFRKARFGVFIHYLADANTTVEEWNRRIDAFDVEGLAKQLESVGARYFVITLGQNSGHYLSPNAAYDRFLDANPSKCSRRDLVRDLYTALEPRGIRLMVYLPSGAPDRDPEAMRKLEWKKGAHRNAPFQTRWEAVIREWSLRWGTHVHGWWFDGAYWPNAMYRSAEAPNFESFAAAARAGNPDSIVAFNNGVITPIHSVTPFEDYTAGEINDVATARIGSRDIAQTHMLSYLGKAWCAGDAPRYTDADIVRYTQALWKSNAVVTYDVPRQMNGLIPAPFVEQLRKIGAALPRL